MIEIATVLEIRNHLEGLKAVVFDLDDTLYSEKEYVRSGYKAVSEVLTRVEHAEEKLWAAFEKGEPSFDRVLKDEGIFSEELLQECITVYRCHKPELHLYEGVEELLENLKHEGMKLGLITDGRPEGQHAKIEALGIKKYMDHIIVTDELGGTEFRKPCGKAFRLMKETLGTRFVEMCYVGDNIRKDFVAPKQLGMRTFWVRNKDGMYC